MRGKLSDALIVFRIEASKTQSVVVATQTG